MENVNIGVFEGGRTPEQLAAQALRKIIYVSPEAPVPEPVMEQLKAYQDRVFQTLVWLVKEAQMEERAYNLRGN